ncbi:MULTISPECIES: hypothetical protein [Curtobacterium]|uniref:Uncharacterized protein n=1 Tax=Curtobacterium citri TaxID=3055139 RepID=A0ABT7T4V8_9MICO|nr:MULTISPECIES: hypothetical protein [Curtobacterium]MDM7883979.1 hypothetical protein [Curtobacterium citri]
MVAGIEFYASHDDVDAFLDHVGEGRTSTIWPWPVVQSEPVSLTREEACAERAVMVLSGAFGPPVVLHRDDPAVQDGSLTAVLAAITFERVAPEPGLGIVDPDRSPVLLWQPGQVHDRALRPHSIGSQARAMQAVAPAYEQWVRRVTSWIRRHGTKVWGLEQQAVRPDLDIRLGTVSAVYALPGALRLLEAGATGLDTSA